MPDQQPQTFRITTVCLGNICRSPMAASVLRKRLTDTGLAHLVTVDSAGTSGWHVGEPMDSRARRTLAAAGYPTDGTSRRFEADWAPQIDLLLAMDSDNHRTLRRMVGEDTDLRMVRQFDPALAHLRAPHPQLDVPDPYYGGDDGFSTVLAMLERASDGVVRHVRGQLDYPGAAVGDDR